MFYNKAYSLSPLYPVFYAKYIDWILTAPLLLLSLGQLAGAPRPTIILACGLIIATVGLGFVGAFINAEAKWAFWLFACFFFVPCMLTVVRTFKMSAVQRPAVVATLFTVLSWLIVTWSLQL